MTPLLTAPTALTSLALPRVRSHRVSKDGKSAVPQSAAPESRASSTGPGPLKAVAVASTLPKPSLVASWHLLLAFPLAALIFPVHTLPIAAAAWPATELLRAHAS